MKIATWNVNSLPVRLEQLLTWLDATDIDCVCLQETKVPDERFPLAACQKAGYQVWFAGQKTYNGVAILSRQPGQDPLDALPGLETSEKRFLAVSIGSVRVITLYAPNGAELDSDKYRFKLAWFAALRAFLTEESARFPHLLLAGDFNVAPTEADVHDPILWTDRILVSPRERTAFLALLAGNAADQPRLIDCFRHRHHEARDYSWWDYREGSFRRNRGLRIDHLLASPALAEGLRECWIDRTPRGWERPSDHTPVVAEFTEPT